MTLPTTLRRTVALAVTAAAVAALPAGAASAATVGKPVVLGPGERIPIDFAGYREPADHHVPKNFRIVREHVELARGEKSSTVLKAPAGFKIVTVGIGNGNQIGAAVENVHYAGTRAVKVRLFTNTRVLEPGQTAKGTLYLLARRA